MEPSITFVSLGPGDKDLITIKGMFALVEADVIYCPSTRDECGKLSSRAADILGELGISSKITLLFAVPMSCQRTGAVNAYENVYKEITGFWKSGKNIAIVSEGDSGFYSSTHYIYERLMENGIPAKKLPGVTSFLAAASAIGMDIVKQSEKLFVVPGIVKERELDRQLGSNTTIVVMKLSKCAGKMREYMRLHPEYTYHYFENVGTPDEFYSCCAEEVEKRPFPYFSLMIIKPAEA